VHSFTINGHPQANQAYAWSSSIEGSDNRRFFAVLHKFLRENPEFGAYNSGDMKPIRPAAPMSDSAIHLTASIIGERGSILSRMP
jgi:hypothetical protein